MTEDVTPYASIHEAVSALEDFLDEQSFSRDPDPHAVRIVLRNGQEYEAKVRQASPGEIILADVPRLGKTTRIDADDITYLAVALPAPRRWLTVALTILGLGDVVVVAARLLRPWLGEDALIVLTVVVGTIALIVFRGRDQPGSNLLPWVVTYCEPTATFKYLQTPQKS